jgi:hypothetical protein
MAPVEYLVRPCLQDLPLQAQLKSDACYPGIGQANVTKAAFNQATLSVLRGFIYRTLPTATR